MGFRHDRAVTHATLARHVPDLHLPASLDACHRAVEAGRLKFILRLDDSAFHHAFRCCVQVFVDGSRGVTLLEQLF